MPLKSENSYIVTAPERALLLLDFLQFFGMQSEYYVNAEWAQLLLNRFFPLRGVFFSYPTSQEVDRFKTECYDIYHSLDVWIKLNVDS